MNVQLIFKKLIQLLFLEKPHRDIVRPFAQGVVYKGYVEQWLSK